MCVEDLAACLRDREILGQYGMVGQSSHSVPQLLWQAMGARNEDRRT